MLAIAVKLAVTALVGGLHHAGRRHLDLSDQRAVRRLVWGGDGRWQLLDSRLRHHYVWLAAPAMIIGPLLWLRLRTVNRGFNVLIDERYAEPGAICTLKGRLKLNPYRQETTIDYDR